MHRDEVKAALEDPVKRTVFRTKDGIAEVWIYPSIRLLQGHLRGGGTLFRLVIVDGALALIEPF